MCGPSSQQTQLAGQESSFFSQLMSSYQQNFGEQQAVLGQLTNTLQPILAGGPNQPGFSAAENAALTGEAINSTGANARSAAVAAGSAAGGNTGVTTGGEAQLQAQIASGATTGLSGEENQINLANAATGRQNFFNAESGLAGVAGLENPVPYAGQATSAGNSSFNEATNIQNMKNQEQADIGGAVAGLALGGIPGIAGGLGNLDPTGGSTFGEQVGNFFTGAAGGTS